MQILPLTTIFSARFFKKTQSSLSDNDVSKILSAYIEEQLTFHEIAVSYNTHAKVIAKIVKTCLSDEEFISAKSMCYSKSVNRQSRKLQQIKTWKERNADWIPPLVRSPELIDKMLSTRASNCDYKPAMNFGNTTGSNNGRYINVSQQQIEAVRKLVSENKSINVMKHATGLGIGKIYSIIIENKILTSEELSKYLRKRRQTFPEWKFEQMLIKSNINFQSQYSISFQGKTKRKRRIYDFFIPSRSILIELDGKAWHDVKWCKSRNICEKHISKILHVPENDKFKEQLAAKHGMTVIRISEFSDQTFQKIVESLL